VDHAGAWLDPYAVVSLVAVAPAIDDDPKDTPLFYFSPIHTVRLYLARQPRDVYVYLGKTLAQLQGSIDVKAVEDLKSDAGVHLSRTPDAVVADVGADDLLAVRCKYSGRRARQLAPSGTERDATRYTRFWSPFRDNYQRSVRRSTRHDNATAVGP